MEIRDFNFFIDREKNKPCLVAGNAPSVINFLFDKFKGVCILAGAGPQLLKNVVSPDYWVVSNHEFPVPQKHIRVINAIKDYVFIFSDTAAYHTKNVYDYDFLKNNIKVPWFAFDDRHFDRKKCEPLRDCCKLVDLYPNRITLQEFMERRFGLENARQRKVGTAVVYALMFAILMGSSPIYLQGIELPFYRKDYIYYNASLRQTMENLYIKSKAYLKKWLYGEAYSHFYYDLEPTLRHFESLTNICHRLGREIYNLSSTSNLNRIDALPYLNYRKVCT